MILSENREDLCPAVSVEKTDMEMEEKHRLEAIQQLLAGAWSPVHPV